MTKSKTTKRALLSSCVALMLCFSMLLGTTYAWFTDTASTAVNMIQAGTLDVQLLDATGASLEGKPLVFHRADQSTNNILWEPGATYYTQAFQIKNAGSLSLQYKIVINGITNGNAKLLEAIDFKVTTTDPSTFSPRMTEEQFAALAGIDLATTVALAPEAAGNVLYLVGHMKEAAGNEYQGLKIEGVGITVYATQVEAEFDSFGNDYDADADEAPGFDADVWDGTIPSEMPRTLIVDGSTQTVHVKDAAAFAYLSTLSEKWAEFYTDGKGTTHTNYANGAGGNYYYSGQWTVSLEADIDLDNNPIAPISIVFGESTGATAFKGNNHIIRNINTTTGLFKDNTRASFSDLVLDNVKATNGALIGTSNTSIDNVTVKNAAVSGTDYVGGLVGYIYGNVNNCKVLDSVVTATGKEAGGLIGYIAASGGTTGEVTDNLVKNVVVSAGNRAAGLIGQVNVGVTVTENTIDNATVYVQDESQYKASYVVSSALASENVYNNTVLNCDEAINSGSTVTAVAPGVVETAKKKYDLTTKQGLLNLNDVLETVHSGEGQGTTINLTTDIDLAGQNWEPIEEMWVTFNGNGHTIKNLTVKATRKAGLFGYAGAVTINNLTIENANITGSQAGVFAAAGEGLQINNCFLKGTNTVTFAATDETWNGIGAITGVLTNSTVNVEIVEGTTVTLNKGAMTTDPGCTYIDDLTGYISANKGTVTNNGTVTVVFATTVSTKDELLALSAKTLTGNNHKAEEAVIVIDADIDMQGAEFSAIIAQRGDKLTIVGNGHTISNVKVVSGADDNTTGQASMFYAYSNSTLTVSDLTLEGITVTADANGTGYAAAVVGYCEGAAVLNNVDVVNATVTGVKSSGMLIGHLSGSLVAEDCDLSGTVTLADFAEEANGHYAGKYIGTLAGPATLADCTVNATVSGNLNAANIGDVYGRATAAGSLTQN